MRIIKPPWVNHNGFPILSIDVHPDGSRFATGGGDNKVRIWSVAPIVVKEAEEDEKMPKLLKDLDSHYNPVNSVNWSRDGKYLASGGDDRLIIIWGMSKYGGVIPAKASSTTVTTNPLDPKSVENWISVSTLRGHDADISGVAFSHDSKLLASCSIDGAIIIWDCTKEFKQIIQLKGHNGFVKGICWDPIGRYLASQSEDKSVIIWRTTDWQIETRYSQNLENPGAFFLRPSWSPDGESLCLTASINNMAHTATILDRSNKWKTGIDFVGHQKAVVVASYSPVIYKDTKSKRQGYYNAVVLGDQDNTITVWITPHSRPLTVIHQLFNQSIQDVTWCPDGLSFFTCSTEGTICYVSFTQEEFGERVPLSIEDKTSLMRRNYGDSVKVLADGTVVVQDYGGRGGVASGSNDISSSMFAENPDQLTMEDHNVTLGGDTNDIDSANNNQNFAPPIEIQPTEVAMQKQKQTIINGRRRITPLNLGGAAMGTQSITKPQPVSVPSHLQSSLSSLGSPSLSSGSTTTNMTSSSLDDNDSMNIDKQTNGTHTTSTTSTTSTTGSSQRMLTPDKTKTSSSPSKSAEKEKERRKDRDRESGREKRKERDSIATTIPEMEKILSKRRTTDDHQSSTSGTKKQKSSKPSTQQTPTTSSSTSSSSSTTSSSSNHVSANTFMSTSNSSLYIPLPQSSNHLMKHLTQIPTLDTTSSPPSSSSTPTPNIYLDVVISEHELADKTLEHFSTIRYINSSSLVWENRINGKVSLITGNKNWSAVATLEPILYVFNQVGKFILANISLRNNLAFLESNKSDHLLFITCDGLVSVWNIPKEKLELSYSELPLIIRKEKQNTIKHAFITDEGKPIITTIKGDSFVYSFNFGEWIKITDRLGSLSEFNNTTTTASLPTSSTATTSASQSTGILSRLQKQPPMTMTSMLQLHNAEQATQPQNTTAFLEKQLLLAVTLESPKEYKHWLGLYAKILTNSENIVKLQDLCNGLLGPSANPGADSGWQPNILGMSKRELLKDIVLQTMSTNRSLQRLVGQFKESLKVFSEARDSFDLLFNLRG